MTQSENLASTLRVLIIEDVEDDALLLADHLQAGGLSLDWRYVDTETGLAAALGSPWDIIFSDFSMPNFSGTRALEIVHAHDPDIPFIFVSGTIGEEAAVEAMKRGAHDFVMKGQLARLLPSVERELREARSRRERRQVVAARNRLAAVLEATPDLVAIHAPDGRLRYLNGAGRRLLGLDTQQQIEGRRIQDIFPEDMAQQLLVDVIPHVREHHSWSGEALLQIAEGDELPVSLVVMARHGPQGELEDLSIIARDISERKRFEAELQHQATHDALTDLPNRFFLMDRMAAALERARRHDNCVAVLFLDMDNFKRINDTLGHAAGDALLQQVAKRLTGCLRPNDTVARHGGDEFTIMVDDLNGVDNTVVVLRKLHAAFERPVDIGPHKVYVTFSTGIALFPHDGDSVEDLLRHADTAMYQSKSSGLNQYRFYAPRMNARGHEYLAMESDLRLALEREQFLLHCQPQVSLRTGQLIGLEVLIRWQHPQRGLVAPAEFVPLLERSGLIIPVGEWVLRQACRLHRQWREAGLPDPRIAVNVSAVQFSDRELVEKVRLALAEEKMPASKLELEITENMVMRDPPAAAEILNALRELGVRTAIDDFGTGYSSLAYLKQFPLNALKIDQTFVADLGRDLGDEAIVEASISLAQKLGLEIVAEGVETFEQLQFLRARDCDLAQGYYLSRPLSDDALTALLPKVWRW